MKKSFWPKPPPIIECDKPQGTVYISSEASVTITLEKLRLFLQDLRSCWKHNFLKKKGNPSSEEKNWAVFSRIFEFDKPQGTVFKGAKFILTITVEVIGSFIQDLRGCWKHNFFGKKSNFPVRKSFWPVFYRIFEFDKPQGTVSISQEASLTITDEKLRSFLQDLRGCWKNNFWKKKAIFPVRKKTWPPFFRIIECHKPQKTVSKGPKKLVTNTVAVIRSIL